MARVCALRHERLAAKLLDFDLDVSRLVTASAVAAFIPQALTRLTAIMDGQVVQGQAVLRGEIVHVEARATTRTTIASFIEELQELGQSSQPIARCSKWLLLSGAYYGGHRRQCLPHQCMLVADEHGGARFAHHSCPMKLLSR